MFDFTVVTQWFDNLLRQTCGLGIAMFMIYFERKVCAFFQCRLGPMRVGPWGSVQVVADVLKMLIKEIFGVDRSDKLLYALAPFLTIIASVGTFSFLPWNNVISAMRGAVQMISYEMSLGLCMVTAVVLCGTMQLSGIIEAQTGPWKWLIIQGHIPAIVAFIVFLIAGNAEANRGPFDLAEAESELTAGYHTEYSGMGFGYFYLAEYLNLVVIAGLATTISRGHRRTGYHYLPGWLGTTEHRCCRFRQRDELYPRLRVVWW